MKKILYILFLGTGFTAFAQYNHKNIDLLARFDDLSVPAEPVYGIRYQSCWGWVDTDDNKEYGIIGSTAGTYILGLSDPSNPVVRAYIPGRRDSCIWREYKTYGKYLYCISDDGVGNGNENSFQIVDLSYLPDSVHIVHDDTTIIMRGHTLYVDGNKLYVASVKRAGNVFSSMNVYSLANPAKPVLLRQLYQDYPNITAVHDMYVVNDTVFASCGNQGMFIYKFTGTKFVQLASITSYPDAGYNHSSFLSKDHSTLYMCDEVPAGMAVKVIDVSDISSPSVVTTFKSNQGATPHNPYVLDDLLVIAYYQDGIYTYDISDPKNPTNNGYFDTHPQNVGGYDNPAYAGCWGAYTDLPSGLLLASDMQRGLFVLDMSKLLGIKNISSHETNIAAYPNPAKDLLNIRLKGVKGCARVSVYDVTGNLVGRYEMNAVELFQINTLRFPSGLYFVSVISEDKTFLTKAVIRH